MKNWKIWPSFRRKSLCDTVRVYQNPANMNPFWHFSFGNWFHFQIISSFIATRRYLDQVTKKHLQTHKVQYFQPIGLENFQIQWPLKQNLHWKNIWCCKTKNNTKLWQYTAKRHKLVFLSHRIVSSKSFKSRNYFCFKRLHICAIILQHGVVWTHLGWNVVV